MTFVKGEGLVTHLDWAEHRETFRQDPITPFSTNSAQSPNPYHRQNAISSSSYHPEHCARLVRARVGGARSRRAPHDAHCPCRKPPFAARPGRGVSHVSGESRRLPRVVECDVPRIVPCKRSAGRFIHVVAVVHRHTATKAGPIVRARPARGRSGVGCGTRADPPTRGCECEAPAAGAAVRSGLAS